jgi:hypothetical protein
MKAIRPEQATSFFAAAGALGVAGFLTRACPGGCTSCATCASALVPMGVSAIAVGGALLTSATTRARRTARARQDAPPDRADRT